MTEVGAHTLPYDAEEAIDQLSEADPRMGLLISLVGDYAMNYAPSLHLFEALSRSITYQQLSGKAAATIFERFCALLPDRLVRPENVLQLSFDDVRSAGLSGAKTRAIQDLAEKTISGVVPSDEEIHGLSDEELIDRLTEVWGIGQWTVEMLMMFRLGRPDVLPATDLGIRKGFKRLYDFVELPAPQDIVTHGKIWKPYRSVASWYLWRAVDLEEGILPPL